jgi:hypothetical protein
MAVSHGRPKKANVTQERFAATVPNLSADEMARIFMQSPGWQRVLEELDDVKPEAVYPSDIVEFVNKTLGLIMWSKLEEICRSVESNHNTIVSSGFGIGKTLLSSAISCYWLTTKDPSSVITLAPTWNQVNQILWRYIRQIGRKAKLPGEIMESPRWEITPQRYGYGLSPRKATDEDMASLQGRHGQNQLIIMDEAAGLDKRLWDTVQGLAVGSDNRILAIGNPSDMSNVFWEKQNSSQWHHISISCLEHPNIIQHNEVIPGAVSYEWVTERVREWTIPCEADAEGAIEWEGSWYKPLAIFTAKVLGETPQTSEDQLIQLSWIQLAQNLEQATGEVVLGLDPARSGGDDSALCVRNGARVEKIMRRKGQDSNKLAAWLQQTMGETNATRIFIDEIGIGAGALDAARKMGLPAIGVNFARNANQKRRFSNTRSECWWNLREALRLGKISLPKDVTLEGDLSTPKYEFDIYGRINLESKDALRSRLGRSPDSGDALALTFTLPMTSLDYDGASLEKLVSSNNGEWTGSRWLVSKVQRKSRWR